MDNVQLAEFIRSLDTELVVVSEGKQFVEVMVQPSGLRDLALKLKDHESSRFDFLFCLSGVDYKQNLGVVYHLRSTVHGHTLVLKIVTSDRNRPLFDSVADIWRTAEFHEREIFDLFGIRFYGHPDMRRLFLEPSAGYPLRKDYTDDINIVSK
jgi:NADH-quinone oxidoreductase subunit C